MRAARLVESGAPLRIEEVEDPTAPPGGVVIRVAAAGVCHSDLDIVRGTFPIPPPLTPGHEVTGTIEAVGDGVASMAPGDAVAVHGGWGCGTCRLCLRDLEQICDLGR